jgi:2-amino-4-hydroxy-6-hydroxymethyldihydropteridine diphosphokinase
VGANGPAAPGKASAAVDVYIGLGANLGDAKAHLKAGLEGLVAIEGYQALAVSSLYETAPVGPILQPPFLNAVAKGRYKGAPLELLRAMQGIEAGRGRERTVHWGPRTLDLDLLLFGHEIIDLAELKVPHPEMWHRAFVLVPLMEIAPRLVLPVWRKTADGLYLSLTPEEKREQSVRRVAWD